MKSSPNSPTSPKSPMTEAAAKLAETGFLSPLQALILAAMHRESLAEAGVAQGALAECMQTRMGYGTPEIKAESIPALKQSDHVAFYLAIAASAQLQAAGTASEFGREFLENQADALKYNHFSADHKVALCVVLVLRTLPTEVATWLQTLKKIIQDTSQKQTV